MKRLPPAYVRNFTFGVEDSLASTVGLLSGVASAQVAPSLIVLTGIILVITEAMSMGIGTLLSDQSAMEFKRHGDVPLGRSLPNGIIMFVSYMLAGFIPIFPYTILSFPSSLAFSVILSLLALFLLGSFNAWLSRLPIFRHGMRMVMLGGTVTIAGVLVGVLLNSLKG